MNLDQTRNLKFDDRIESYSPFFDFRWAQEVNEIAETAKVLDELVFDLMVTLQGISQAAAIPHFAVDVAKAYSEAHQLESLDNSLILKVVNHLAERLGRNNVFSTLQNSELRKDMLNFAIEFMNSGKGKSGEFPRQQLWDTMVTVLRNDPDHQAPKNQLRVGIWSTQRNCYSGLFFAYEDFVVRCIHTHSGSNIWVSDPKFNQLCRDTLDSTLAQSCWFDSRIDVARKVRHALAHVGGRETGNLKKVKHGIAVVDGWLQILPMDVLKLYDLLKPRIKLIVEWAARQTAFS